jgi:hypothetical protein
LGSNGYGASGVPRREYRQSGFQAVGLLAIQDGGRRKPVDTFAKETLIRITGRSTYTGKTGPNMAAERFRLVGFGRDARLKNEPMVLISSGQLCRAAWAR